MWWDMNSYESFMEADKWLVFRMYVDGIYDEAGVCIRAGSLDTEIYDIACLFVSCNANAHLFSF